MVGKVLGWGGKAALWYGRRKVRSHRRELQVALGVLGAGVAVCEALKAHERRTAMRGKVVVIAGGSRGLGLEIAREFGRAGAHLVLASRHEEELRRAVETLHGEGAISNQGTVHIVATDVSKADECERMIASAIDRYGRVDVLVNCAGVMVVAPMEDQTTQAFEDTMKINFFGQLYAIQAVLPHMLARGAGNIVNVASVGGKIAVPHMLPYVASKFALVGFGEGLHAEMRHKGIRVTTVCPGLMRTGAHVQVEVAGDAEKEYRWFSLGATLPVLSISARAAAEQIFAATVAGKAEITITPQAWLGARFVGLAPNFSQWFASWVNQLILPAPNGNKTPVKGAALEAGHDGPWSEHLLRENNQPSQKS